MDTNFREWLVEMRERFRENPARAPLYVVYTWYLALWFGITSRWPVGTNVYDREWDVLVILDACRVDTLREVADEYDYIEEVDDMWSIGSHSAEWISQTFTGDYRSEVERTRYITANAHASRVLEQGMFPPMNNTTPVDIANWDILDDTELSSIDMVWESHHDETARVVLPEVVTDYGIAANRESDENRLILHYMQPHLPYIGQSQQEERAPTELEIEGYQKLEQGDADQEEVYELYKDTLRLVLDEVAVLLENIDAERVAITADHGEAFGEMRAYGHPEGFPHPIVKKVPWLETSAKDTKSREPNLERDTDMNVDMEEHLRDLGYR